MELRGNVPTRVEKLQKGEYDAIILASAGLARLGLDKHITGATRGYGFHAGGFAGRDWVLLASGRR